MLCFFFSCKEVSNDSRQVLSDRPQKQTLIIDTFLTSPETDSCSCFFSTDSTSFRQKNYVYAYDLQTIAFMKLNNVMTKFTQTEYAVVGNNSITRFTSDLYEMILEIKDVKEIGKEATLEWGSIRVTDKNGNVAVTTFYGECGCYVTIDSKKAIHH